MEIHLIWAQDKNGGIGINGQLPWHIPEDLKNFKKITLDSVIIMGRKTWESLPIKPLPKRINIVLSRQLQDKVLTFKSYNKCIKYLKDNNISKVYIIGGRSIYKLFFDYAHFLHITNIKLFKNGINEFFPIPANKIVSEFKNIQNKQLSSSAEYSLWEKIIFKN
tara:strand:- start:1097 stop:1588 length:492 start_codon:yes stop_codon:yes gene_type:complete